MYTEVHVLHRMDHNIDELHTGHLRHKHIHVSHKQTGTKIPKCFHAPTIKSMFPSSLLKYSISFSKRCFSLQTCRYFYLDNHRNKVTAEYSQIFQVLNMKCDSYNSNILTNKHRTLNTLRRTNITEKMIEFSISQNSRVWGQGYGVQRRWDGEFRPGKSQTSL